MQYSPHQLKEKLLEGIDNDNNVVDMPKVSEVVRLLEKYPISREILEETRIGRLVNDIRRKTTDKQLAKRAKELVRSWQKVVNVAPENQTTVNGDGMNSAGTMGRPQDVNKYSISSPAASLGKSASLSNVNKLITTSSVKSSLSPGQPLSKSFQTAASKQCIQQSSKRSRSSPQLNPSSAKRTCISPNGSSRPETPDSISSQSSRTSSTVLHSDRPHTPSTSIPPVSTPTSCAGRVLKRNRSSETLTPKSSNAFDLRASQSESCLSSKDKLDTGQNGIVTAKTNLNGGDTSTHSIETKGLKTTIRFNKTPVQVNGSMATPKKRGRGRPPKVKPQSPSEKISPPAPSVSKKLSERKNVNLGIRTDLDTVTRSEKFVSLTPKVKSTAELMQTLQAKSNFSVGRDTARKIQTNMIQKEMDDEFQSVVPEGARPRHHRKKGEKVDLVPPSTPVSLKTKTEMVHKFLETSVDQSSPDDLSPLKYEMPRTESPGNASSSFDDSVEGNHDVANKKCPVAGEEATFGDQMHAQTVISRTEPTQATDKPSSLLSLEEIYSKYPVLDLENIVIHDGTYDMPEPIDITEEDIGRLHLENWDGVNGCFDTAGSWRDWTQTLSFQSVGDDHLHILPYVNIDD